MMDILLYILGGFVLVILGVFFVFDDAKLILWYLLGKKNFRNHMIQRYQKADKVLTYLGTMHHMHYNFKDFNFLHLKAVLSNLKPDLLLVESRPEELADGNLADGPTEMLYLHLHAKRLGISVEGIDFFNEDVINPGRTNKVRDGRMLGLIESSSQGKKNVLVAIGATHMLIHAKHLRKLGYKKVKVSKEEIHHLFEYEDKELTFPKETVALIKKRIEHEKQKEYTKPKWIEAKSNIIRSLENFLDKIEKGKLKIEE